MFARGFEKEAGLKHWATAAAIAASPMKGHAGAKDMLNTVGRAAKQTEVGRQVTSKANEYLKRAQNVRLFGKGPEGAGKAAGSAKVGGRAGGRGPDLSIRDGNRLQYTHGGFEASLDHRGGAKARYQLSKNWGAEAEARGGERKAGVFFKKEF